MKEVAAAVATIAIAILAFLCYRQTAFWKDSATLFAHSLQVTTNNYIAHEHLAAAQKEKAHFEASLENYRAAYRIKSDSVHAREGLTHALIDLAKLDRARGKDAEAMKALDEAQRVGGQDEKMRAAIALAKNDVNTAIELYRKRLRENTAPDDAAKAHNDLGAALASAGKDDEAVAEYRKSLALDPMRYDAHMNLGALLSRMDRNTEAIKEFQAAASIQPTSIEPLVYAALTYQLMNRWSDALAAATRAYQSDPKASNAMLTSALRMPHKETNFEEWLAFLRNQSR
jgi:tetratricopeptide (TPR) repeat protein